MKVYLSPSGQIHNVGVGKYGTEEARCREIANLAAKLLKAAGVRVDVTPRFWNRSLSDSEWLRRVVARSNAFGADVHVAIHTNAGGRSADGTDAWYFPGSQKGYRLTTEILKRVARVSPGSDGGLHTKPVFYETRAANAPVCYIELLFHTNWAEVNGLLKPGGGDDPADYAKALADGICAYGGIKFSESTARPPDDSPAFIARRHRPRLKQMLLSYALTHGVSFKDAETLTLVGSDGTLSYGWGDDAKRMAWRVSNRLIGESGRSTQPTVRLFTRLKG